MQQSCGMDELDNGGRTLMLLALLAKRPGRQQNNQRP
jgi:hypothetical protein